MNKYAKALLSLSLPAFILLLACLGLNRINDLSPSLVKTIPYLPYLLLLIALVLAYRFNQSRIFYLALVFVFILSIMPDSIFAWAQFDIAELDLVYSVTALLVPLNVVIFSLVKERGILSRWGYLKFSLIIGQVFGAAWIVKFAPPAVCNIISSQFLPWNVQSVFGLEPLGLVIICLSTVAIIVQLVITKSYYSATSAGMILASALLIFFRALPLAAPVFGTAIAVMMIIYVIQNSYSMAYLDELTAIPGRRALREAMMKLSGNYVVAMVDIDFFKKFNDQYGHDVGDDVLRMVASRLEQVTGGGKAFRYGGEEFAVIFSGKGLADALPHLEKLRESIAGSQFSIRGQDRPKKKPKVINPTRKVKKVSVTVSIGAAEKSNMRGNAQEVLTAADKALYRAKNSGRNRVSK